MRNRGTSPFPDQPHRIACRRCGDPIEEWCITYRFGFWDADAQNYDSTFSERRYCRECWDEDEGRANGAHYHPDSADELYAVLAAADGKLAAVLCWWTGRPAIRVVDGEPEAAVTKRRKGGTTDDGTPILKFEAQPVEGFDREEYDDIAEVPDGDRDLVLLLDPAQTAFAEVEGGA